MKGAGGYFEGPAYGGGGSDVIAPVYQMMRWIIDETV